MGDDPEERANESASPTPVSPPATVPSTPAPVMAATFQVPAPEPFTFSRPEEWPKWRRRFERFRIASGLASKDDETQVNTLIYSMGDEADDILRSFSLSEEDRKKYLPVLEQFDTHFVQRRNVIYERARFNMRVQEEGEPVEKFTSLYALAEHCNYGSLHNEMIRDRIVVGIRNASLSEKLQLNPDLTLDMAITQARQSEAIKQQQPLLRAGDSNKADGLVGAIKNPKKQYRGGDRLNSGTSQPGSSPGCSRCGRKPVHDRQYCPARDAICRKCNKRGHYQACCRSKVGAVMTGETTIEETSNQDDAFMGTIQEQDDPWVITLQLNSQPIDFCIDTGAEVTVISTQAHGKIGSPKLSPPDRKLRGPDTHTLTTLGFFTATLSTDTHHSQQPIYVVDGLDRPLVGRPAIEKLGLVRRIASLSDRYEHKPKLSLIKQYPLLFKGLGRMRGEYTIKLQKGAQPYALSAPRRVPIPLMAAVKAELQRMQALGVIAKVDEPTDWCAGMVVVPKTDGRVRICVDLTRLNQNVCRERHIMPAVDQTLAQLGEAKLFTKLDANSGFWQIPLSPKSALLTTFITPYGRFCFRRLPFGISSAPEHFQRRMSETLSGLAGTVCMMDDILVHGRTKEEHDERLTHVLQRLQEAGITLNTDKCCFSQTSVTFLGHLIDGAGIRPDPEKVAAIQGVRKPENIGDIRRFLGMVNQLSKFSNHLADLTQPLRELLIKDRSWIWGESQEQAFDKIKQALTNSPVLALFDPSLETIVSADASSYGLGAVLLQRQRDSQLKPVAFVSRSMTPTEKRYAQIEREALAFTWACERLADYLVGLKFHIHTDHKPLVPLFSSKNLEELPIRVQRFRLRMMRYNFTISHVPGKKLLIADTLSRAPCNIPAHADTLLQEEVRAFVRVVMQSFPATDQRLEQIKTLQKEDSTCREVVQYCQTGWPKASKITPELVPFYHVASELNVQEGILLRGARIIIPVPLRQEMLNCIHSGHQGIVKCRERARQSMWWPGLSTQLEKFVKQCPDCQKAQHQRSQPLLCSELPQLPWQKIGTDLFEWQQKHYLIVVDYYSRYIEISQLARTTAEEVVKHTKSIFARHGIPEIVISDNGPQYSSEVYASFAKTYHFRHITSSPYYAQANGEAERAVGTIKRLLQKSGDPYLALLSYRTTPLQNGFSPSELLMCRMLRTTVPSTRSQRAPKVPDTEQLQEKERELRRRQKSDFDRHHGARDLPPLSPGDTVWLPEREVEGTVEQEVGPRSYEITTPEGTYRRNRRTLIQLRGTPDSGQQDEGTNEEVTENATPQPVPAQSELRRSSRTIQRPERLDPSWS